MEERRWIEVKVAPKSFGPQQWPFDALVGIMTPILTDAEVDQLPALIWIGPESDEPGHVAWLCDVVVSLQAIEQDRAVEFWRAVFDAGQSHIRFGQSVCELVDAPSLERSLPMKQKR